MAFAADNFLIGSRTKRLLSSYTAGAFSLGARVGQQLLLFPAFLVAWGPRLYEDWLIITAAAAFFALIDLGTRPFLHNTILLAWAARDVRLYHRTFRIGLALALVFVAVGVIMAIAGAGIVYAQGILETEAMSAQAVATIFAMMALRATLDIPADLLGNTYWARGEVARGINVTTVFTAVEVAAVVGALALDIRPVLLPFIYVAPKLMMIAFIARDIHFRYPGLELRPAVPNRRELRTMISQGLAFSTIPAAQLASFQGIILVLAAVTPESYAIVLFTVLRTLAGFARQIVERIASLTAAEMARSFAASDRSSLVRLYANSSRLIGGLTGLLVGLVWVFTPSFLEIWAKGQVHHHPIVLGCLLAALALGSPGLLSMRLLHQVNRPRPLVSVMLAQTVMALSMTALFGGSYGAAAAAFAVATSEFIAGSILLPWFGHRTFFLPAAAFVAKTWLAAFVGGLVSLPIAKGAMYLIGHETLWQHIVAGNAWAAAIAVPATFIIADAQQRDWLMRRLRTTRIAALLLQK